MGDDTAMKKLFILGITVLFLFCLCSCGSVLGSKKIFINGKVEETIEVKSNYSDKGATYPDKYTLVTEGSVNTNIPGKYSLIYRVYSSDGELVKEMHRFVNVVDSIPPSYTDKSNNTYYAGFTYTPDDFMTCSDNYDTTLSFEPSTITLTSDGAQNIEIVIKDSSNNSTIFTKTINVTLDVVKLLNEVYKYSSIVTTTTTGIGSKMTNVKIDSNASFSYFDTGSLHYLYKVKTSLGSNASIQISAKYGEFNKASITYHINGSGSSYSVGFATIDSTRTSVSVSSFSSTINDLKLDTGAMLAELNESLPMVLASFHDYMNNTLHLDVK